MGGGVRLRPQEDLGGAVPQRHDLVRQRPDRRAERPRETEVGELEHPVAGHEEVLRLEVAVHHAPGVAEGEAPAHLEEVGLNEHRIEESVVRFERLLQVAVEEFEDQVQLPVLLDAVLQVDDVRVRELPQQGYLAQRRGGDALVLHLEADALQRDDFVGVEVARLVDDAVRPLAEVGSRLFDLLIAMVKGLVGWAFVDRV